MAADVQKLFVKALQLQQPALTDEAARELLHAEGGRWAPRDFFITHQDVFNLRTKLEQQLYRSHQNDALNVRTLYNANHGKVCGHMCGCGVVCADLNRACLLSVIDLTQTLPV